MPFPPAIHWSNADANEIDVRPTVQQAGADALEVVTAPSAASPIIASAVTPVMTPV